MKLNFNLKRIRRDVPNPANSFRFHRGEYGHNYLMNVNHDRYYADTESLIKEIKKTEAFNKSKSSSWTRCRELNKRYYILAF